jgi:hypothetical protein
MIERLREVCMGFLKGLIRPEVRRTCQRCGSTWVVPRTYTKRHSTGAGMAPLSGTGGIGGQEMMILTGVADETTHRVLRDATASAQIRASYSMCPECGSNIWTQKRLWSGSGKASGHIHNPGSGS